MVRGGARPRTGWVLQDVQKEALCSPLAAATCESHEFRRPQRRLAANQDVRSFRSNFECTRPMRLLANANATGRGGFTAA